MFAVTSFLALIMGNYTEAEATDTYNNNDNSNERNTNDNIDTNSSSNSDKSPSPSPSQSQSKSSSLPSKNNENNESHKEEDDQSSTVSSFHDSDLEILGQYDDDIEEDIYIAFHPNSSSDHNTKHTHNHQGQHSPTTDITITDHDSDTLSTSEDDEFPTETELDNDSDTDTEDPDNTDHEPPPFQKNDYSTIFKFDFNGNDDNDSNTEFTSNLTKIRHERSYKNYKFEAYGNLLSNILLNAFSDDMIYDDANTKSIQIMSYNICSIIIDFLEFHIPKALCIEHNSYYCYYTMNDKLFSYEHISRIKTIIGRLPMRNNYFRKEMNTSFVYIGNNAITYCGKYNNRNKQKGMKQNTKSNKRKIYESIISFPIKYNIPIFTNNINKNINVENDFKELWKYIMNVDMGINNNNHPILCLMPSQTPFIIKEALLKFAFKLMHIPAICIMDKKMH